MEKILLFSLRQGIDTAIANGRLDKDTAFSFYDGLMIKLSRSYMDTQMDLEIDRCQGGSGLVDLDAFLMPVLHYADDFVALYPEDFLQYKTLRVQK